MDFENIFGFCCALFSLVVIGLIILCLSGVPQRIECSQYGDTINKETNYKYMTGCWVKDGQWFLQEEYRYRIAGKGEMK